MRKAGPSGDDPLSNARERLEAARLLLQAGLHADAIGRAYYAMYLAARALLSTRGQFPRTHQGVVTQFGLVLVRAGIVEEAFGRMLSIAKTRREQVEYETTHAVTRAEAESAVADDGRFVARIPKELGVGIGR